MRARAVVAATAAIAVGAAIGGAMWRRRHREPGSYTQRFRVQIPRPLITRRLLFELLDAQPGEHVLEVGPGLGYYSLSVAERLGPKGKLDILDIQPKMLHHTLRLARRHRLPNMTASCGSVEALPYRDEVFDAAFLVTVLGEVNDPARALRELHRVVRPGGRLVVGETLADPDWVSPQALQRLAAAAGFRFERRTGPRLGYFSRFTRA
ncbi:methyltransferase domain-containing protein [Thermopolyspora sp. NPDC052614]|uniref:methyltransferase domain-containing protein n=1 Tax=Thermopolyspora sp. NPDC052614 TaxID=3155682 RepID=UPI00342C9669